MLPWSTMSRAMRTVSGRRIERAIASVMRMLAWWGTKQPRSSTVMPARSTASRPTLAMANDAQRKTALPCIVRWGMIGESEAITSRQSSR